MKPTESFDVCMDTLKIVGDMWALAIINKLAQKPHRFNELQQGIEGLNAVTLHRRLTQLEKHGFITRHVDRQNKQAITYELAQRGREFVPVITALRTFTQQP